jgi:methenyltetrahydrofolate cyclohydrolase
MELVDRTLAEVVDLVAAREPAPGGGSAAALTGALAAALTEMSAAFALTSLGSATDADAGAGPVTDAVVAGHDARLVEIRDRAHELRGVLLSLAEDDTRSYAAVLDALATPRSDPDRPARLQVALAAAAEVPLAIAVAAAEVGEMATEVAQAGNAHLLGDATAGALIAEAAARSAARLVELNLAASPQDARLGAAETAAQRAWAARMAVLAAATPNVASAGEPPSP